MKSNRQEKGRPSAGRSSTGSAGKASTRRSEKTSAKEASRPVRNRATGSNRLEDGAEKGPASRRSFSGAGRSGEAAKNKSPFRKFEKRTDGTTDKPSFRSGDSFRKTDHKKSTPSGKPGFKKRFDREEKDVRFGKDDKRTPSQTRRVVKSRTEREENPDKRSTYKTGREQAAPKAFVRARRAAKEENEPIRLNRYIANSGICSRRKADELIQAGVVTVNGAVVDELGFKVDPAKDEVRYNGELLRREKKVYVLLNKPKDYITTTEDPQERRTVMQLVSKATKDRIYPVGRLDRNTTGLLLLTNDGDLAEKLSHPRNNVTKIYLAELSRNFTQGDMNKIQYGLELEDGFVKPDAVSYVQGGSKREIGIQIHSGKNRIVRRIFEHLGYEVLKLDRTIYANLTKKDLPRGKWRFLDEKELIQLRQFTK